MISNELKEKLMRVVMAEVDLAVKEENAPFAAILIDNYGNIVEKAHNTVNSMCDPTLHAEINLISKVCRKLRTKDLSNYCLISNAWSCSMCMSACVKAKIQNFVFGASSEKNMNPNITIFDIKDNSKSNLNITTGVLMKECQEQIENARKILEDYNGKY